MIVWGPTPRPPGGVKLLGVLDNYFAAGQIFY